MLVLVLVLAVIIGLKNAIALFSSEMRFGFQVNISLQDHEMLIVELRHAGMLFDHERCATALSGHTFFYLEIPYIQNTFRGHLIL